MRRIAIGRIIGLLIAIIGIGISIRCASDALRMNAEFYEWLDARPMQTAIDLSRPGDVTVPFHQTCSVSHGEAIYLECDIEDDTQLSLEKILGDLSGNIVIKSTEGDEIESVAINNTARYWDDKIVLAWFDPFRTGDYVATIHVDTGAPALAGSPQTIYAKYQLCGLEQMPAAIAGVFAFVAGIIGLSCAVSVLPGLLRYGFWRDLPKKTA